MNDRAEVRLQILLILGKQVGYVANQEVLLAKLKEKGFILTRDQLHIELAWLDSTAEAIVDMVSGGVHIASLTGDGLDVIEGALVIGGIRKPRPDELAK